jgi:hypothetical protein
LQGQQAPAKADAEQKSGESAATDDKQTAKAEGEQPDASGENKGGGTPDPAQSDESEGPIVTETGRVIPYGVLSGTRRQLAKAQENLRLSKDREEQDQARIAQLEAELASVRKAAPSKQQQQDVQEIADRAGITDAAGNSIDVTKIDVASLRGEFPAQVVNLLEQFQSALVSQNETISQLRARDHQRTSKETLTEEEQLQADIDAVPFIARLQADESAHLWNAAVALDKSISADPEWAGKSRIEIFREVARQLGAPDDEIQAPEATAPTVTKDKPQSPAQVKQQVAASLKRAAARSAPNSLSDLPAGSPAAQSEAENIGSMDVVELASKFEKMTPAQQEAYLAKHA